MDRVHLYGENSEDMLKEAGVSPEQVCTRERYTYACFFLIFEMIFDTERVYCFKLTHSYIFYHYHIIITIPSLLYECVL